MERLVSTVSAALPHPPERVWAVVTDLDRWRWRSDLGGLERTGEGTFTEYGRDGFPTRFTVTDCRPPDLWAFDLENANLTGHWTGTFQRAGDGTRVTFTESVVPRRAWMRLLVKGYLRRQQARYLRDLRRALETGNFDGKF